MNISVTIASETMAAEVLFDSQIMHVRLLDGREISVPVERFPNPRNATDEQRKSWQR